MKINENITGSLTDKELKEAILEYINKKSNRNFYNIKDIKLVNGTSIEHLCITNIEFTLENQTEKEYKRSGGVLA